MPTELLKLPLDEWALLMAVADAGAREDEKQIKDQQRKMEQARRRR